MALLTRLRRSLFRLSLPLLFSLVASPAFAQDTSAPYASIVHPRVLVMTSGGAGEAQIAREGLTAAVTSVNFPTTFIDNPALISRQALSSFDIFVQFGPARLTPDQEKALADFVGAGGGFIALHDAIDGPRGGPYEKLVGGAFVRKIGPYHINLHITDEARKTPLMAGVRDFEVLEDQIFASYAVDAPAPAVVNPPPPARRLRRPGPAHALMTGFAMDNTVDPERLKLRTNVITNPIAAWTQEVGKGRAVYLSMGHTAAGMGDSSLQRLYENAFRWVGREDAAARPRLTPPPASLKRPRVLMRSGAGSQAAEFPRRAMARVFTDLNMPVTYIEDVAFFTPQNLAQFDIVVNSGSVDFITPDEEKAVSDFVQNGGSFLGLHNASAGGAEGGAWEKLIGGHFVKHPPPYRMRIHATEAGKKSPIMQGVDDFEVVDEHHFVTYDFEPAPPGIGPDGPLRTSFWTAAPHVLFQSDSVDNTMDPELARYGQFAGNGVTPLIGGWWREEGKGRMVFLAPGHMIEVMNHPMMQKLYRNSLKWLARQD